MSSATAALVSLGELCNEDNARDALSCLVAECDRIQERLSHDGARMFGELQSVKLYGQLDDYCARAEKAIDSGTDKQRRAHIFKLCALIEGFCPPFMRFGYVDPGEPFKLGTIFDRDGFEVACIEGEIAKLAELPDDPQDVADAEYVAVVSDHGNVTLYARDGSGGWAELWSIV